MYKALRFKKASEVTNALNNKLFLFPEVERFEVSCMTISDTISIAIYPKEKSGLGVDFEKKFGIENIIDYESVDKNFTPYYIFNDKALGKLLNYAFGFEGRFFVFDDGEEVLIAFIQNEHDSSGDEMVGLLEMLINFSFDDPKEVLMTASNMAKSLGYIHLVENAEEMLKTL